MSFCWATLRVKNLDTSVKFYTEILGLSIHQRFQSKPGVEIVFLGDGETKIELITTEEGRDMGKSGCCTEDISLGFSVDSLEGMMGILAEQKILLHSGPFQPNPHTRFCYVLDPDGFKIQLVERTA